MKPQETDFLMLLTHSLLPYVLNYIYTELYAYACMSTEEHYKDRD